MAEDVADRIAAKKAERGQAWRDALPAGVNNLPGREARLANVRALYSPAVVALDAEIDALRREQWGDHPSLESMPESRRKAAATLIPPDEWAGVQTIVEGDGEKGG